MPSSHVSLFWFMFQDGDVATAEQTETTVEGHLVQTCVCLDVILSSCLYINNFFPTPVAAPQALVSSALVTGHIFQSIITQYIGKGHVNILEVEKVIVVTQVVTE